jgi:hypothetical protein
VLGMSPPTGVVAPSPVTTTRVFDMVTSSFGESKRVVERGVRMPVVRLERPAPAAAGAEYGLMTGAAPHRAMAR